MTIFIYAACVLMIMSAISLLLTVFEASMRSIVGYSSTLRECLDDFLWMMGKLTPFVLFILSGFGIVYIAQLNPFDIAITIGK